MEKMNISKTQAKKKIYQYKFLHGMAGSAAKDKPVEENIVEVKPVEIKPIETKPANKQNETLEAKLETLMKLQEEHKKAMDEYLKLYNAAKAEFEAIKQKTDILCNAMDILND